jgi:hypothetical protein
MGKDIIIEAGQTTNRGQLVAHNGSLVNSRPSSGSPLFTNEGRILVGPGSVFSASSSPSTFVQTTSGQTTIQIRGESDADFGHIRD